MPTVQKFMTPMPHSIGMEQPLSQALGLMRTHRIRHLPVLSGGRLEGVVTDRDLALIQTLSEVDPELVKVEDAMTTDLFTVSPNTGLDEVASDMAEHKFGCAVVVDNAKVVGIFTTVDASRALAELLRTRLVR